jgi:type I restriction enzyme S subunit
MFESLALIKFNQNLLHNQYIKHVINYFSLFLTNKKIKGVAVKHLPIEAIVKIILPLPPLAEQRRIVAKIEELMLLCDRLKKPVGLQGL